MSNFRQYQRTCSVCGKSRLCACATCAPNPQPNKPPVVTIIPAKQLEAQERPGGSIASPARPPRGAPAAPRT